MDISTLEQMIKTELPDALVDIRDVRGDGQYFDATVTSGRFEGMTRVQQHRLVHQALEQVIGNDLHALKLTTKAS